MVPLQHLSGGTEENKLQKKKKPSLKIASESVDTHNRHITTISIVYYLYIDLFGLQLHLKSQSATIIHSCTWSHTVCSLDIVEIGTWHHTCFPCQAVAYWSHGLWCKGYTLVPFAHTVLSHKLTQESSWKWTPARESTNSHLQSALCNLLYKSRDWKWTPSILRHVWHTANKSLETFKCFLWTANPKHLNDFFRFILCVVFLKLAVYYWVGPQKC